MRLILRRCKVLNDMKMEGVDVLISAEMLLRVTKFYLTVYKKLFVLIWGERSQFLYLYQTSCLTLF